MTEYEIQLALAQKLFGKRRLAGHAVKEILLRNVSLKSLSGGFYEADFLRVIPNGSTGRLMEIEIKVSIADFRRDANKKRLHDNQYVRCLYYAIPSALFEEYRDEIEGRLSETGAGLIIIDENMEPCMMHRARLRRNIPIMPMEVYIKLLEKGTMKWWCEVNG